MQDTPEFAEAFWRLIRIAGRPRTVDELVEMMKLRINAPVNDSAICFLLDQWCASGHVAKDSREMYQITRRGLQEPAMPVSEESVRP